MVDRFDLGKELQDFLAAAVTNEVLDAAECFVLGANHAGDPLRVIGEVLEIAFAGRHCPSGAKRHKELAKLADAFTWKRMADEGLL